LLNFLDWTGVAGRLDDGRNVDWRWERWRQAVVSGEPASRRWQDAWAAS
jgi:hypothetical protein